MVKCHLTQHLFNQVLAYFLTLSSEAHSEAWTPVLLLLFTQMEKLQVGKKGSKVQFHQSQLVAGGQVEKVCCSCLPSFVPALVC